MKLKLKRRKFKTGRRKFIIPAEDFDKIEKYIKDNNLTIQMMADKIGISYRQLYYPLLGHQDCGEIPYKKIKEFIETLEVIDIFLDRG